MTAEVHMHHETLDTGADLAPADTDAADIQGELGQQLRPADMPEQPSAGRDDGELAAGPAGTPDATGEDPTAHTTSVDTQKAVASDAAVRPDAPDEDISAERELVKRALDVQEAQPEQPKPIPDLGQPHGPYTEWLQQQGDAGAALEPYLQRLILTKDDYLFRGLMTAEEQGDDLDKGLLDRLGDGNEASSNGSVWQLTGIVEHSVTELQEHPELIEDGQVNWLGLSTSLLDRAQALDEGAGGRVREGLLTGAMTAAFMSENPDDRIAFLERTAERDLKGSMVSALENTGVGIINHGYRNADVKVLDDKNVRSDRSIMPLGKFRAVFFAEDEDVARYKQLVERDLGEPADAHTAMKDMIADYDTPGGDAVNGAHAQALEAASVAPSYVDRYRVDPTKAERFALEEMFVQAQMEELFPGGDTSRVRHILGVVRPIDREARQLVTDMRSVIQSMSKPVARRFQVPGAKPDATWTREQLAAWRYRQLKDKAGVYDNIQRFVDPLLYGRTSDFPANITETSESGAAFPGMARQAVANIKALAHAHTEATGDAIAPEELRDLMQANRRVLMKMAALHIDNFAATLTSGRDGDERNFGQRPHITGEAEIVRGSDGKLNLRGSLFKPENGSSHSAARLACVALRVNVEGKPADSDEGRRPKTNSIDLLSEIFIDEAYERGAFASGMAPVAA